MNLHTLLIGDRPDYLNQDASLPRREYKHWVYLVIAGIVIAAAFSLHLQSVTTVVFTAVPSISLPRMCSVRTWFGFDCPGCGLTRSFVSFAHGDLHAAMSFHPLGIPLAILVMAQIPYRLYCLASIRFNGIDPEVKLPYLYIIPRAILALLLAHWVLRMIA